MLNSRLYIKDGMKEYENKAHMFVVSPELLRDGKLANKSYKDYLEKQKKQEEARVKSSENEEKQIKKRKAEERASSTKKKLAN